MTQTKTRTERDSMGAIEVTADRYWGAQTERLEHDEREVIVEPAGDDFVGRLHDELHLLRRQLAELGVGEGGRLFQDAEGPDHGAREAEAFHADLEVVARPCF